LLDHSGERLSRRQRRRGAEAQHVDVEDAVGKAAGHAPGDLDRERGLAGAAHAADGRDRGAAILAAEGGDQIGDLGLTAGEVGDAAGQGAQGRRRGLGLRAVP